VGNLISEAIPRLIAGRFRDQSAIEMIDWIECLADHPNRQDLNASSLFRTMTFAVAQGHLDRGVGQAIAGANS